MKTAICLCKINKVRIDQRKDPILPASSKTKQRKNEIWQRLDHVKTVKNYWHKKKNHKTKQSEIISITGW